MIGLSCVGLSCGVHVVLRWEDVEYGRARMDCSTNNPNLDWWGSWTSHVVIGGHCEVFSSGGCVL